MTKKTFTVWLIIAIIAQFVLSGPATAAFSYAVGNMLEDIFSGSASDSGSGTLNPGNNPNINVQYPSQPDHPDYSVKDPSGPWDGSIYRGFSGGSGTESDPYLISSPQELAFVAESANERAYVYNNEFVYYRLCNDIDLNGREWTPIGTEDSPFYANFDGNGYSISRLYVDGSMLDERTLGLFGVCYGSIYNVLVFDVVINAVKPLTSAGALCGMLRGEAIECNASEVEMYYNGERNDLAAGACFGGLIGYADNEERSHERRITYCNSFYVIGYDLPGSIGGLIGYSSVSLGNCSASSEITNAYYAQAVGGLIGKVEGTASKSINDTTAGAWYCHATVNADTAINNFNVRVGGLVGISTDAAYYACYSEGYITASYGGALGGFAGYVGGGFIDQCFSGTSIYNDRSDYSGGFIGDYHVSRFAEGGVGISRSLAYHIPEQHISGDFVSTGAFVGGILAGDYKTLDRSIEDCCYSDLERSNIDAYRGNGRINSFGIPASHEGLENPDVVFEIMKWDREIWDTSNYDPSSESFFTIKY